MVAAALPQSLAVPYSHLNLHATGTWLVLSDLHIPFHDERAIELAFDQAVKERVKGILLNGDIADMHQISEYPMHRDEPDYDVEVERVIGFLAYVRVRLPAARVVYKEGNHEERLERYLAKRCPQLWKAAAAKLSLPSLFEFDRYRIEHVGDGAVMTMNELHILHGHEYRGGPFSNPVGAARWLYLKARNNAICGHFHQSSFYPMRDIADDLYGCWSTGCGCYISPRYRRLNQWNHGFAMVDVGQRAGFEVRNHMIIDGKIR